MEDIEKVLQDIEQCISKLEKIGFSDDQIEEIMEGFAIGLKAEQIKMYAKPELSAEDMKQFKFILFYNMLPLDTRLKNITAEQVKAILNHVTYDDILARKRIPRSDLDRILSPSSDSGATTTIGRKL